MTVLTPTSPDSAVRAITRHPNALPLAGGTDLMVGWNMGTHNSRVVGVCAVAVQLSEVDEKSLDVVERVGPFRMPG